jgi:hypothetical protein
LDAGKRPNAAEKLFEGRDLLRGLFVVHVGKTEPRGEHVVNGAAEVAGAELLVALEQETGGQTMAVRDKFRTHTSRRLRRIILTRAW